MGVKSLKFYPVELMMNFEQPEQAQHTMILEITRETGEEEWFCPECGRRLLLQWPPNYKKTVIETGDEFAMHNASKGGLKIGSPRISQEPLLSSEDEERLEQWGPWLDKLDFSGLADADIQ